MFHFAVIKLFLKRLYLLVEFENSAFRFKYFMCIFVIPSLSIFSISSAFQRHKLEIIRMHFHALQKRDPIPNNNDETSDNPFPLLSPEPCVRL